MSNPKLAAIAAAVSLIAVPLAAQELPRKAGEWPIFTADGKQILLSSYQGKVVVLAFILTTCPHCQHTIGILSKLQPEYGPRGVQVVAAAVEANPKTTVPAFIKNFNPPFPVGFDDDPDKFLNFVQYTRARLPLMPIVLIVDRQGMVRFEHEGHDEKFFGDQQEQNFRDHLNELLKPAPKQTAKKAVKKGA
jgi:peroxiredoxin